MPARGAAILRAMLPLHRAVPALLLALVLCAPAHATPGAALPASRPRNVILVVADGCGPAAVGLGRMVAGRPLALDSILVGALQTRSASSRVTDSAAAATALATGVKTRNTVVGLDPEGRPLGSVLEAAVARGLATGLVTTSSLTDATPAGFLAHLEDRHEQDAIAAQVLERGLDVLLGGGRDRFLPEDRGGRRTDGRDLVAEARRRGVRVAGTPAELAAARETPLLGLFAPGNIDLELDRDPARQPSLEEMLVKALALLEGRGAGFLLVAEGARIDDAGHDNDPAALARDVVATDRAVAAALAFARRDGRTLVVVVADHETGGLTLGRRVGSESVHDMRPEALLGARASTWRMADSVLAGADPVGVAERNTGFADLTEAEKALLRASAGSRDSLLDALRDIESVRAEVAWSTGWHTATDVLLHAFGPGRERFAGLHDNTDVARIIAGLLGLDLEAATARLRNASARTPQR